MDRIEPFLLERFFARHEFSARRLMSSSDCETTTVRALLGMEPGAEEAFLDGRLGYTETRGAPSLREDIAALYSPADAGGPGAEGIFVHAGAEEAILNLCLAILGPGDHVVVNRPAYQSLEALPRWRGAAVSHWDLRDDGRRWRLDPDDLAALLGASTKLVIVNAPHNPTGALPTKAEFEAIVRLCREAGAILLVDEVYRGLERDPGRALAPACEAYENGVSLNVLSKTAGLAGLRIGWLATRRKDLLDAVAVVKDYNTICSSAPSEFLAGIAARNFATIAARNHALCAANIALFEDFVRRHPDFVALTPPEGSSICFPRLAGRAEGLFGGDSEAMALELLAETGILLIPGKLYGFEPRHWRLGFGRADFAAGLRELESWVLARGY
ncbi:MAG TPA: pyridoxal phosphate-dependent aminotransferase [Rectinemataceae bacterium]|nr:pyridoxal phosphate-dependent aminotransferase [Rectinemataceae bacterium]